jgi:glutamate/aspartate transport system substrate-binding protein
MRNLILAAGLLGALAAPAPAQELTGTLKKIKDTGTVALGVRDSSLPFSYLDDKQKVVGYTIDICMKVIDEIKSELKLDKVDIKETFVTSSTRIPLMANGTIDLECASTTNNADRQKQVSFSNSHFLTASRFVSKKSQKMDKIDDLKGKSVVSVSGSVNLGQLIKVNAARSLGANVLTAKDVAEAFLMVETDRAQAFVMDDIQLVTMIAAAKEPSLYTVSSDAFSDPEPFGIMLRKDDARSRQSSIAPPASSTRAPEIEKIYNKWFMEPIPPRGLVINVPMPASMKKSFQNPSDSPTRRRTRAKAPLPRAGACGRPALLVDRRCGYAIYSQPERAGWDRRQVSHRAQAWRSRCRRRAQTHAHPPGRARCAGRGARRRTGRRR